MAETIDKPKSPKASDVQIAQALEHLDELNNHAMENSEDYSRWALEFLGQALDRAEAYGDKTYFSVAQVETISKMHSEKILGEESERQSTPKSSTRFDQYKAKGE